MKKSEFEVKPVLEEGNEESFKPSTAELIDHDLTVPALLLDHYADMAGAFDDSDLASQCACMLPAVLVTIGPAHWPLLRHTYYVLASHRSVCCLNIYLGFCVILINFFVCSCSGKYEERLRLIFINWLFTLVKKPHPEISYQYLSLLY